MLANGDNFKQVNGFIFGIGGWYETFTRKFNDFFSDKDRTPKQAPAYYDGEVVEIKTNFPPTATIGEIVQLEAIPYDENGNPVSGVRMDWQVENPNGEIESNISGIYGFQASGEYKITVKGAKKEQTSNIAVSSGNASSPTEKRTDKTKQNSQSSLPYEEWDSTNIPYAREPRNQRGETPGKPKENSNFNIIAPILSIAGRAGMDLNLNLTYNSRLWTKMGSDVSYDIDKDQPAPGWTLGFGKIINLIDGGMVQYDGSGGKVFFNGSVYTETASKKRTFNGWSNDGSFVRGSTVTNAVNGQNCFNSATSTIDYPDGTQLKYYSWDIPQSSCVSASTPITMVPYQLRDTNGNFISIYYYANDPNNPPNGRFIDNVVDTQGRLYKFNYTLTNGSYYLTSISGPSFKVNGVSTQRTFVRFNYKDHTLAYNFNVLNPKVRDNNNNIKVLSSIYYPATNSGYWFGESDSYSPYGMIRKIEEQKGMGFNDMTGAITSGSVTRRRIYSYPENITTALNDIPDYSTVTETWDGMPDPANPAITQYVVDWTLSPRTTTVIAPYGAGKTVEYSFNCTIAADCATIPGEDVNNAKAKDGMTFKTEFYDSNNVKRSKDETIWEVFPLNYAATPTSSAFSVNSLRPKTISHTDIDNGVELTKRTVNDTFSYFNTVTDMHEEGYNGETLRKTKTEYLYTGGGSFYRPKIIQVFDGNNNRIDYTEYTYTDVSARGSQNCDNYGCQTPAQWQGPVTSADLSSVIKYKKVTTDTLEGIIQDKRIYEYFGNLVKYIPSLAAPNTGVKEYRFVSVQYPDATFYVNPKSISIGDTATANSSITTSATYDFNTNSPLSATDENQKTSSFEYDLENWRLKKAISPTGAYSMNGYDDLNRIYTKTGFDSNGQIVGKTITKVNGLSLPYRQESLSTPNQGAEVYDVVETKYDDKGRVKLTSNPFKSNESTNGVYWSENFYDSLGRIEKTKSADGSEKFNYYDESARPSVASNSLGHSFRIKDPTGRQKWYRTDSDGNIAEVVEPNPNGDGSVSSDGLLTKYTYDSLGQLTRTEQGAQERKFRYDSLGRLTNQKMAETKATLTDDGSFAGETGGLWSDFFTYDDLSNIATATDARGVKTIYSYQNPATSSADALNRLFSINYDTSASSGVLPSPTVKFEYQPTGNISQVKDTYTENIVNGNPQRVVTNDFHYDTFGRVDENKTTLASRSGYPMTTNYSYDSLGRITDVVYPNQYGMPNNPRKDIHYDFDSVSRLSKLKVDNVDYASNFSFNNFDQITSMKIGPSGVNQITEQYDYDPQSGNLLNQKVVRGGTALLDLSYQYKSCSCSTGGSGQITAINNNLDRNKDRTYDYDKLGRLKKVTGGINQAWSQGYSYDRYGNRLSVDSLGFEALRPQEQAESNKNEQQKILNNTLPESSLISKNSLLENVKSLTKIEGDLTDKKNQSNADRNSKKTESSNNQNKANSQNSLTTVTPGTPFDFDGDHKADLSTWRRTGGSVAAGTWAINNSQTGQTVSTQLGTSGNQIAPADYDGDGKTDKAVWNPETGDWTVQQSSNGQTFTQHWGMKGDAIVPADYDGDGKADFAIWRPSTGIWWIIKSSDSSVSTTQFGSQQYGDIPMVGDYDGDGRTDITVWRPSNGIWYVYVLTSSNNQVLFLQWGQAGDVPVPADYDGDHKTDLAIWRPSTGTWWVTKSSNNSFSTTQLGSQQYGDIPVSADYDGDGREDIAIWRPSTGGWYIVTSSNGQTAQAQFGTGNDIAVPSAYRRRSSAPNNQNMDIPRDGFANLTYDNTSNRITTSGFEYDLAGNQTKAPQKDGSILQFQYDAAGRMVKVKSGSGSTIATYIYGIGRERLVTQEGDENSTNLTYYVWKGESVIAEYTELNGGLNWSKNYVYLSGKLLATQERNGSGESAQFDHPDQLGTRIVTDPVTGTSFEQSSLPFGTALGSESSGSINRRFTSYDRSASTGLDYAVNRFYDSAQGRFTTVDPIKVRATKMLNPQTLNLYSYTANDPVNKTDPSGLDWGFSVGGVGRNNIGGSFVPFGGTGLSQQTGLQKFLAGLLGNLFGGSNYPYGIFFNSNLRYLDASRMVQSKPTPIPGVSTSIIGSNNTESDKDDKSCYLMGNLLSGVINNKVKNVGGKEEFLKLSHAQLTEIVGEVDKYFSEFYVGKQLDGVVNAIALSSKGSGPSLQPPPYGGQSGFKAEYREGNDLNNDQTHHFVTYFSGGINGMSLTTGIHKYIDDNKPDQALGDAGYYLGASLNKRTTTRINRNNPRAVFNETVDESPRLRAERILGIAGRILSEICE